MHLRLVALAVALSASSSLAAPQLLDDTPTQRAGWLLAQAGAPMDTTGELAAIDARIAQLLAGRPSNSRIAVGVVLTVLGGLGTVGGGLLFFLFFNPGNLEMLVAVLVGLPLALLGIALLIPGIVMWASGIGGQQETDEAVARLRARRQQLLDSTPRPLPPPPPMPQVWRGGPEPRLTVAAF